MTRALRRIGVAILAYTLTALAAIACIVWALSDDEKPKPLKFQPWTSRDDALYRNACKEAA